MNEITILLTIFSLLFLIENKSINNLANYIGIVISLAILISLNFHFCKYISFILILIQISALTILFGLIIMLFPKNNTLPYNENSEEGLIRTNPPLNISYLYFPLIILISLFLLFNFNFEGIYLPNSSPFLHFDSNYWNLSLSESSNSFLLKIGQLFYTEPNTIIKFFFLTFLLFFAIIALFYLILSTI